MLPAAGALSEAAEPAAAPPESAREMALTLGFVHRVPWPLKPRRHLTFLANRRPDGSNSPPADNVTCTTFAISCQWTRGPTIEREVRVQVSSKVAPAIRIAQECKRQRYAHGVALSSAHGAATRSSLTFVVAMPETNGLASLWGDPARVARIADAAASASDAAWEFVVVHAPSDEAVSAARALAGAVAPRARMLTAPTLKMDLAAHLDVAYERARGRFVVVLDPRFMPIAKNEVSIIAGLAHAAATAPASARFVAPAQVEGEAPWQRGPVSSAPNASLPGDNVPRSGDADGLPLMAAAETRAVAAAAGAFGTHGIDWRVMAGWSGSTRHAWRAAGGFARGNGGELDSSDTPVVEDTPLAWHRWLARRIINAIPPEDAAMAVAIANGTGCLVVL